MWCARELVGREPFALLLPDVLVQHKPGCLKQMIDAYDAAGDNANVIAVEQVPMDRISAYGVVGVGKTKGNTSRSPRWWRSRRARRRRPI